MASAHDGDSAYLKAVTGMTLRKNGFLNAQGGVIERLRGRLLKANDRSTWVKKIVYSSYILGQRLHQIMDVSVVA